MDFNVGDSVVHRTFGLGEILGVEERVLADQKTLFYLVRVRDLTVWVPVNGSAQTGLRSPTPANEFEKLFTILKGSGQSLSEDRLERKSLLRKGMADGKAETICQVIRDLYALSRNKSLNDDDRSVLHRAQALLCAEWGYALSVPLQQAEDELQQMLMPPAVPATN